MALSFWNRFFGREEIETSKNVAERRLRMVLMHDRLDMSEQVMNEMRVDLIAVIGKYLVIDEKALDVTLTREEEGMALVANIPILNVRIHREDVEAPPAKADSAKPAPAKAAPPKVAQPKGQKKPQPQKQAAPKGDAAKA